MTATPSTDEADFETAVGDPAAFYANPGAIAADATLSKAQKQRFLAEWAEDLAARETAADEGMGAEDSSAISGDAALMTNVHAAIAQVEAQPDSATAPRTLWRRLQQLVGGSD